MLQITNVNSSPDYVQSALFISSNDSEPRDDGIYTCRVNLTVAETDNFIASDNSRVLSAGKHDLEVCTYV